MKGRQVRKSRFIRGYLKTKVTSDYDKKMYWELFDKTKSSEIDGEAKLLICLIMQKFDNYNDEYKMVSNSILKQNSI